MIFKDIRMTMPKKWALLKKRANGRVYVYYIAKAYRNKDGKPTSDQVAIGWLDEALIPNKRYFDFFPENKPIDLPAVPEKKVSKSSRKFLNTELPENTKIKSYGVPLVMMSIAKQIGLLEVLQNNFPHKWESLLTTAFYMVSQGNVMMYIADWFEENNVKSCGRVA